MRPVGVRRLRHRPVAGVRAGAASGMGIQRASRVVRRALTWSYGGGTQSAAIAVLVAQGQLPVPERIVMADTSREATETWEYLERHIQPLLARVDRRVEIAPHTLATVDLYPAPHDAPLIPAFTRTGKLSLFCSVEWKRRVVRRWLRQAGYGPRHPVVTWIGISLDEVGRAKRSDVGWQRLHYPLLFDRRMTRAECRRLVLDAGLPEPPKSSCWMCPFRRNEQWARLKQHYPEDWARAVALDEAIRARDAEHALYVHHSRVPLADADLSVPEHPPLPLFGEVDGCDSGYCWV